MPDADVIIAGAGPGGLMTSLMLAQRGLKAIVVEKRPLENLGRPLRVGVEETVFPLTGLPKPQPPALLDPPQARELISPDRKHKLKLASLPLVTLDLRAYLAQLAGMAEKAGVQFLFQANVTGPITDSGKVVGLCATDADGKLLELRAPLTIDASGIVGALRHQLADEMGIERQLDPFDVANVWQESREIHRESVMDLLQRNRVRPQVAVSRLGFMGPFSMFSVYVDLDHDAVELTVGLPHDARYPTAEDLIARYVSSRQWIGELITAGGGLVPVRRPFDSMVAPGFACVGDAACQAIPQHASGVASALLAGKLLAETAAQALAGGDASVRALWPYNRRWMESRGMNQANSELFRRFLLSLSTDELSMLFASGLVTREGIEGSLEGLPLELPKSAILGAGLNLWRRPRLLARLYRLSRDSLRVLDSYQEYPATDDPDAFSRFKKNTARLFGKWTPKPTAKPPEVPLEETATGETPD